LIAQGSLIRRLAGTEIQDVRVLFIEGQRVVLFDCTTTEERNWPFEERLSTIVQRLEADPAWVVLKHDPYASTVAIDTLPPTEKEALARRWRLIGGIAEDPDIFTKRFRGRLVQRAVEEARQRGDPKGPKSSRTVWRLLKRYWRGGGTQGAPVSDSDRRGGRGDDRRAKGIRSGRKSRTEHRTGMRQAATFDQQSKDLLLQQATYLVDVRGIKVKSRAYDVFKAMYGDQWRENMPSEWQFRYALKRRNLLDTLKSALGPDAVVQNIRPLSSSTSLLVTGPGDRFEVDETPLGIPICNRDRTICIGRAHLYAVIDVWTDAYAGFHATLAAPSWMGVALALINAVEDKVEYARALGFADGDITADMWPMHHLPSEVVADRGTDSTNYLSLSLNSIGVKLSHLPARRPELKGNVERALGVGQGALAGLPGTIPKPGEYLSDEAKAWAMTLPELRRALFLAFVRLNHRVQRDQPLIEDMPLDVPDQPIAKWQWAVSNRSGKLRSIDVRQMYVNLLPQADASVTRYGVTFKGLSYLNARVVTEEWRERVAAKGTWKVPIRFDPRTAGHIFITVDRRTQERCDLVQGTNDADVAAMSFDEWQALQEIRKDVNDQARREGDEWGRELHRRQLEIGEQARVKASAAATSMSKAARRRAKGPARATERSADAALDARRLAGPPADVPFVEEPLAEPPPRGEAAPSSKSARAGWLRVLDREGGHD